MGIGRREKSSANMIQENTVPQTYASSSSSVSSLSRNATPNPQIARSPRPFITAAGHEISHDMMDSTNLVTAFSNLNLLRNQNPTIRQTPLANNIGSPQPQYFNNSVPPRGIDSRGLVFGPNFSPNHQNASSIALTNPSYLEFLRSSDMRMNQEAIDLLGLQKAYFQSMLQKSQYNPSAGQYGNFNHEFYGNTGFVPGLSHSGSPMHFPLGLRNNFTGPWPSNPEGQFEERIVSSLLEDCKGNKTKGNLDFGEIAGHVADFSSDQYGSRFIQEKLDTARTQEKNMIFDEIMPRALSLMTDVFGNYVIQKLFERGSASQVRHLAEQFFGHVLSLSLQMYGCRVIQKALEVIELDQQTRLVAELDGHVMRCVRDQNGNHVIQKCIECIPEVAIQFVVTTFYGQVEILSTHPYGCRVIQRVLEHCRLPKTQCVVMSEILQSVDVLAQDQYGNYVVQHVLQHGKPTERSAIVKRIFGKVVELSQQKFASNVVEKCLAFGSPEERQILVDEMLGNTDENEPLQVMMKDQFANYVVQKVLETCDDRQLELILNRIKVHLDALKKYTYGKHIVARVEKLVAAGERRIIFLSSYSA